MPSLSRNLSNQEIAVGEDTLSARRRSTAMRTRACLATLLLGVTALDGLAVSPRLAAVRTQLAARRTPAAAAAARMGIGTNGTNAVCHTGLEPLTGGPQGGPARVVAAQACYSRV